MKKEEHAELAHLALTELAQHYPDLPGSPASGVHDPGCKWICKEPQPCIKKHVRCSLCTREARKAWGI